MSDSVNTNTANPAKKKPRGKPFVSGDPRINGHGHRTAADVAFNRSLREVIVRVGNESVKSDKVEYSRVELMVRGLYVKASKGDVSAFNALIERVEGKLPSGDDYVLQERINKIIHDFLQRLYPVYGEEGARKIAALLADSQADSPTGSRATEG